ncbi:MAG: ABC transporter ATP-binding protein, partial [bacterium]
KIGMLIVRAKMAVAMRERLFRHLQRLSLSFHKSARSGDLLYRLTSDLASIAVFLIRVPQETVYRTFMIFSHLGIMLFMEWRLTVAAFAVIPPIYYFNRRIGKKVRKAATKKRKKESDVISVITENVTATALIQAYGREDLQQSRFETENREKVEHGIRAMKLSKIFSRISDILIAIGTGSILYLGGVLALDQAILPGTLILFYSYLRKLYKPLSKLSALLMDITKAQVGAERVLEVIDNEMIMEDDPDAKPAPPLAGRIEYRDIHFSYQKEKDVLKDVNFTIEPGETIALVGHSGAGKSTLISLFLRFYDPQKGQILIDGQDIRKFTMKSLREQITILFQDAKLFNRSVRENIAFGKDGATEEEMTRAAKQAQAHDFIMEMPGGYDTIISEGGKNLSGGQKQRINIARAMIRNTPILILDEPATALDTKTEAEIQKALHELVKGRTTFIIAHKFGTIVNASKIMVLENSRLAGFGTHEELMCTCGHYQELYSLQFGNQLPDGSAAGSSDEEIVSASEDAAVG